MQPLRNLPIAAPERPVVETTRKARQHGNPILWLSIGLAVVSTLSALARIFGII